MDSEVRFLSWETTPKGLNFVLLKIKSHQNLVDVLLKGREQNAQD